MNKKSSKRCCIFHKAKEFGESSSESEESEDSVSSGSDDEGKEVKGCNEHNGGEGKELDSGENDHLTLEEKARRKKEKEKRRREREKRRRLKIHQRNHA